MEFKEFTGKTVEEAIENGLSELHLTKETADIAVLEEPKKKLFGWTKARVKIAKKAGHDHAHCDCEACKEIKEETEAKETAKEQDAPVCAAQKGEKTDGERTVEFLEGLFELLRVTACTELVSEEEKVVINVTAANTNSIIGARGVMLDAIQTLAGAVANTGRDEYRRVVVDCENYRETREATLTRLADNLAQKAVRLGKKIKLEPMNPYERRIIHAALSDREDVTTQSEGKEPNRCIVVIPSDLEDPDAPALSVRKDRGYNRNGRGKNDRKDRNEKNGRGRNGGYHKRSSGSRSGGSGAGSNGGTTMKPSVDFFGIFLGNSGNDDKTE